MFCASASRYWQLCIAFQSKSSSIPVSVYTQHDGGQRTVSEFVKKQTDFNVTVCFCASRYWQLCIAFQSKSSFIPISVYTQRGGINEGYYVKKQTEFDPFVNKTQTEFSFTVCSVQVDIGSYVSHANQNLALFLSLCTHSMVGNELTAMLNRRSPASPYVLCIDIGSYVSHSNQNLALFLSLCTHSAEGSPASIQRKRSLFSPYVPCK